MKKLFLALCFFSAIASANAGFMNIQDTTTSLKFDFSVEDFLLTRGGVTETYTPTDFTAGGFSFFLQDRFVILPGNIERFTINATGVTESYAVDFGSLNFSGSYLSGGKTVTWSVQSEVTTRLRSDFWSGSFSAQIAPPVSVPDAGSSLALAALALGGLLVARRKLR